MIQRTKTPPLVVAVLVIKEADKPAKSEAEAASMTWRARLGK